MAGAIAREKRLKKWRRAWKLALIELGIQPGGTCTKSTSVALGPRLRGDDEEGGLANAAQG
jgi:hypothetical protein